MALCLSEEKKFWFGFEPRVAWLSKLRTSIT
jgi:hypothetical protein